MWKNLILIIFIAVFIISFKVEASLAPQVYLTNINLNKNSFDPGEKIEGNVTVFNYEDLVVSDLVFHFQVLSHEIDGVATKTIDEKISEGTFTLSPGREIRKIFSYTLPENLPNDNFKYRVQLANSRGEEMGWIDKLISVGGDGKFLTLDNYWIKRNGEKLAPGAGVNYKAGQIPEIELDVFNSSSFSINAFPKVITYKRNVSDILKEEDANPVILKPGDKKTMNLFLPELRKPETYLSEVRFYDNESKEAISNPIYFRWIITGEDAEILFVKPDKISYRAGEKAEVEIQVAGAPNYHLEAVEKGFISLKFFNDKGEQVGESQREIELIDDTLKMSVLIKKDVDNPKIKTRIIKDARIIDEYNFTVVPEKEVTIADSDIKISPWAKIALAVLILAILSLISIFIYKFYYPKMPKMKKLKIFSILFLFFLGLGFSVWAAVEVSGGCRDTLMIYNNPLPNRIYNVNDVVNFSGKFRTSGSASSLFFNKISFYISQDKDIPVKDCCGDIVEECSDWQPYKSCKCEQGYLNYYGASSSFYDFPTSKNIMWFNEVKFLEENNQGVYKIGTLYPSDTLYGEPWVAFNQSFIIPDNLGFSGPVRFYVQYSGTHWTEYWQWSVTYQKSWINENMPPYVEAPGLDGSPTYCDIGPGKGKMGLRWVYSDKEGDKQSEYQFQIAKDSTFNKESLVIDSYSSVFSGDPSGSINTSPSLMIVDNPNPDNFEITYNSQYFWRVRVKDENGNWSQWKRGPEFETFSHASPWPELNWQSKDFIAGEIVSFFDDDSKCYKEGNEEYNCKDNRNELNYEWDFDYQPLEGFTVDSAKTNPTYIYTEGGEYIVRLRITDETGSCTDSSNISIKERELPPPGYKPIIPPSSRLLKFLGSISNAFLK